MVDNPLACERHDATDDGFKVRCVSHDTLAASNRCYQCPTVMGSLCHARKKRFQGLR
jgi:hypothetical protein